MIYSPLAHKQKWAATKSESGPLFVRSRAIRGGDMEAVDKAMEIHLRLRAEKAREALSHGQLAEYLVELAECIAPAVARQLVTDDAKRMAKASVRPLNTG